MNTRQYPRTMNEAFPRTADYACALERSRSYPTSWWACMAVIAVVTFILLVVTK
jgi:hypothetical protein